MPTAKKKTDDAVTVEWRELPPKIGRKPVDRPDEIDAGMRIRRMIEESRRARGIPREGILYPGEEPDRPNTLRKKK